MVFLEIKSHTGIGRLYSETGNNTSRHWEKTKPNKKEKKNGKRCKLSPEAALKSDIFSSYLVREILFVSGKSQGVLKSDACSNHVCSELVYFEVLIVFYSLSHRLEPGLQTSYLTSIINFSKITWFHNRRPIIGMMTAWLLITGLTQCRWSIWFDLFTCALVSRSRMLVLVDMSKISRICRCMSVSCRWFRDATF